MAFTDHTWAFQEEATSANLNLLRDNFRLMGPHLIARKTADESVTSSTVLQNDDHLFASLGTSEAWHFRFLLHYTGDTTGDLKVGFTWPASSTATFSTVAPGPTGTVDRYSVTSSGSSVAIWADTSLLTVEFIGIITTGGTSGTLQLQWAQNTSSVTALSVKANSTLWGVKLA